MMRALGSQRKANSGSRAIATTEFLGVARAEAARSARSVIEFGSKANLITATSIAEYQARADAYGQAPSITLFESRASLYPSYGNGYKYRRRIILEARPSGGIIENAILKLTAQGDWLRSTANGGRIESGGLDIQLFDFDGSVPQWHEYDEAEGRVDIWLRNPSWDSSQRIFFILYYGKPSLTEPEYDPELAWSTTSAVWVESQSADLTGLGRDLDQPMPAAFDGATQVSRAAPNDWLNGLPSIRVEAICTPDQSMVGTDSGIFTVGPVGSSDSEGQFTGRFDAAGYQGGGTNVITSEISTSGGRSRVESGSNSQRSGLQTIGFEWADAGAVSVQIDGAMPQSTNGPNTVTGVTDFNDTAIRIGVSSRGDYFEGRIHQLRIRRPIPPRQAEIEAMSVIDSARLWGIGSEETFGDTARVVAVPDEFEATVGQPSDFDVLADDQGGGLTIENVTQPSIGVVTAKNNKITFQADAAGETSFGYAARDTAGRKSSARAYVKISADQAPVAPGDWRLPYDGLWDGWPQSADTHSNFRINEGDILAVRFPTYGAPIREIGWHLRRISRPTESGYSIAPGGNYTIYVRRVLPNGRPDLSGWLGKTSVNGGTSLQMDQREHRQIWRLENEVPTDGTDLCWTMENAGPGAVSINLRLKWSELDPRSGPYWQAPTGAATGRYVYTYFDGQSQIDDLARSFRGGRHAHGVWTNPILHGDVWKGCTSFTGASATVRPIGGSNRVRMVWTPDRPVTAYGLHCRVWRRSGYNPTSPLVALVKEGSTVVAQATFAPETVSQGKITKDPSPPLKWIRYDFPGPITLNVNQTRTIEFLSDSTGYETNGVEDGLLAKGDDGSYAPFPSIDRMPENTRAATSSNGGSSWDLYDVTKLGSPPRVRMRIPAALRLFA